MRPAGGSAAATSVFTLRFPPIPCAPRQRRAEPPLRRQLRAHWRTLRPAPPRRPPPANGGCPHWRAGGGGGGGPSRGDAPLPLRTARGGGGAPPPRSPPPPPRTRGPRAPPPAAAEFKRAPGRVGGGEPVRGLPAQTAWRRQEGRAGPGRGRREDNNLAHTHFLVLAADAQTPAKLLRPPRHNFRHRDNGGSGAARPPRRQVPPVPMAARRPGGYQGDHFLIALHCFPARRQSAACAAASPALPPTTLLHPPSFPAPAALPLTGPDEEVELVGGPLMQGRRHVYAAGTASH